MKDQDFQDRGEPWRQALGIDGTAGDAQDEEHPFIPDSPGGPCVVCGLAESYRKHTGSKPWIRRLRAVPWLFAAHLFLLLGRAIDGRREP